MAALSPRQRNTQSCPEYFDFHEGVLDIASAQFPIRREATDGERCEIIVQVGGAALVAQVIRQKAKSPCSFAPWQVEHTHWFTGPVHDHFRALAGTITFIRDSCQIPTHSSNVSIIPHVGYFESAAQAIHQAVVRARPA